MRRSGLITSSAKVASPSVSSSSITGGSTGAGAACDVSLTASRASSPVSAVDAPSIVSACCCPPSTSIETSLGAGSSSTVVVSVLFGSNVSPFVSASSFSETAPCVTFTSTKRRNASSSSFLRLRSFSSFSRCFASFSRCFCAIFSSMFSLYSFKDNKGARGSFFVFFTSDSPLRASSAAPTPRLHVGKHLHMSSFAEVRASKTYLNSSNVDSAATPSAMHAGASCDVVDATSSAAAMSPALMTASSTSLTSLMPALSRANASASALALATQRLTITVSDSARGRRRAR